MLFYFPIIFLFLTQVKGLSPSQVLLSDAVYTLSNTFWQIPITRIVDKIGKKNCLIIGNIIYSLSILSIIFIWFVCYTSIITDKRPPKLKELKAKIKSKN